MADYHSSLMKRLRDIQGISEPANAAVVRRANPSINLPSVASVPTGGGSSFDSFVNSIAKKESGGNYRAVNSSSGALGKYQVMPANVASWSKQALGYSITPQQYLSNPQLQDQIARAKLSEYFNKYGAAGAAVAWYAGEGNAQKYMKNPNGWNKPQGNYPSIASYVQAILGG